MAIPTLTPASEVSAIVLPATGSTSFVASKCPIGVYTASADFLSGASDQVAYTYQKLGGDILDIELTTGSFSPYITQIHFYRNQTEEPVLSANLPRPVQIRDDVDLIITFRVDH